MNLHDILSTESRTMAEGYCRARATAVPADPGRLLTRVLGEVPFYVPAADVSITPRLALDGFWEMWGTQAVARALRPEWCAVDVGASVGYYSALLAACGCKRVLAVEPHVGCADSLHRTAHANGWAERVEVVYGAAVKPGLGDYELMYPSESLSDGTLVPRGSGYDAVSAHTLDHIVSVNAFPRVDFLKIDTNGSEPDVLVGATGLLAAHHPQILLDWDPTKLGLEPDRHLRALVEGGYEISLVHGDGVARPVPVAELRERSLLWLRPKV